MAWSDIALRAFVALLAVGAVAWLYVAALLWIGRRFRGVAKAVLAFPFYLAMGVALVGALAYLLPHPASVISGSWSQDALVLFSYICVVAPAFWYIRLRLKDLRAVGFVASRDRYGSA